MISVFLSVVVLFCVVGGMMVKLAFDVLFAADYETGGFYFVDLDSYMINFISTKGE